MADQNRPLSPHLQVYRPQVTSVLSITHRLTGLVLVAAAMMLTYWLAAAAYGPDAFGRAQAFLESWPGRMVMFGFTFSLFYHLCNGIRHLGWDMGWGFELTKLRITGIIVVVLSLTLTLASWVAAYGYAGKL